MSDKIHIVLTFDDGFWAPAYATMRSIGLSSHRPADIVFHLFHRGLSDLHRQSLNAITTEFGAALVDHDLTANARFAQLLEGLTFHPKLTNLVYARLLLPELLPEGIERILYLDCDMMVRAPIEELAELDLAGKPIAAVLDAGRHRHMLGRDLVTNKDLFDFNFAYFNAGLLVIDREGFAQADLPARTRAFHEAGVLDRIQYDQAILNLVFKDNWFPLDWRWNLTSPQPAHEVFEPRLVHYTGPKKPWTLFSGVAYARVYRHVMTNDVFKAFFRERLKKALLRPFKIFSAR